MTIKAIAAAIGVSPSTVSRAMSGKGRLSAATRHRVLQRIEEAGYAPNLHARRLVTTPQDTLPKQREARKSANAGQHERDGPGKREKIVEHPATLYRFAA